MLLAWKGQEVATASCSLTAKIATAAEGRWNGREGYSPYHLLPGILPKVS